MKVKRELLDYLAKGHLFDVPPTMRESELKTIWDQVEKAKESGQLDEEDQGRNEEELKAHYTGIAERRVRLGLLLSDVANKNQLTVSPEELSGAVAQESAKYPGQEQAVVDYYQNNPQSIEQLRAPLLEDKVVDFLLGMANVSEKAVSSEKLLEETGAAETDGPVPAAT
jgi:trigger factor